MTASIDKAPKPETQTWRSAIICELREGWRSCRELSFALGMTEKDVLDHLQHVEKSLRASANRMQHEPSRCLACGFVFAERSRLSRPGRCPSCKSTRISLPRFRVGTK